MDELGQVAEKAIREAVNAELRRRDSLERRGIAVITTAGTLNILLFGLAALVTKQQAYQLPQYLRILLTVVGVLFFFAAATALGTNLPTRSAAFPLDTLKCQIAEKGNDWDQKDYGLSHSVAIGTLDALKKMRSTATLKAILLIAAIAFEALAIGVIAVVVGLLLIR
jgi:hypothetical protein